MPAKKNDNRIAQLAVAVAGGQSVAAWSRKAGVAVRTSYGWAATAEFRGLVAEHRRKLVDRAIGRLTAHVTQAVEQIARLAKGADSEAVRLQASRAILAELVTVSNWAELEQRLEVLEQRVKGANP